MCWTIIKDLFLISNCPQLSIYPHIIPILSNRHEDDQWNFQFFSTIIHALVVLKIIILGKLGHARFRDVILGREISGMSRLKTSQLLDSPTVEEISFVQKLMTHGIMDL